MYVTGFNRATSRFVGDATFPISVLAANLIPSGNDIIKGGSGNDVLIGCGGNDTITGGEDDDILVGFMITPSAIINSSMVPSSSILPTVFHTIRMMNASDTGVIIDPLYGTALLIDYSISSHEFAGPLPAIHNVASWQSSTLHHLMQIVPSFGSSNISHADYQWQPKMIIYGTL
jgi:Ca2+-binding RTX toxin-like protein